MTEFQKILNNIKNKLEIDQLYNVEQKLITEELGAVMDLIHEKNPCRSICPCFFEEEIIVEEVYFQGWDVNTSCITCIENIVNEILKKYEQTRDIDDLEIKYPIKQILSEIDYSTLSNYKNFHKFLDLMKENATGYVTISVGKISEFNDKDSYYEPPMKFGYKPKNGLLIDSYYQYIEDITSDCKNWHQIIQKIMKELFQLQDFGTINISSLVIKRKKELKGGEQILKTSIAHEISHLIKFLIRINGLNYNYGLYYSRKDLDYNDRNNYFSKPDEWKELAATYIEELRIMFDGLEIDHSYNNSIKFINAIFKNIKIPYKNCFTMDEYAMFLIDFKEKHFHEKQIKQFIKTTYQNSLHQNTERNTWKIFKKFITNEFKRRYKILDQPKYLYHATYKPLLKSITKNGLGNTYRKNWSDSKHGVVYLAKDPDVAESYAESSQNVKEDWLDEIIILKIDTNDLDKTKLELDKNVQDNDGDTLQYHGIIKNFEIESE